MALTSGMKLGPYEIQSPLGSGGMGEVYRARDTRLDRTVAVKILPSHLSENADARQRFDREARTISSLNHPNICTLYDVGHQDGIDFLVMEYLEGETLADRLHRGPLPIEQVVKYGIEICAGLEKAHRSGVVHRDLKPGNIMLTKSGAKLMDFGLAKSSLANVNSNSSLTVTMSTPLASHPLTAQGTVVGTFQYMAPEQVEGKEADARSDIFALGAVLYEMATSRRAFEGKTAASAMAAVLERDPAPISSLQPSAPAALDRLVKTCLAKDPDERWQTAHDVKLQLNEIAQSGSQSASLATPIAPRPKRGSFWPWAAAAFLAIVAAGALVIAYFAIQKQAPVLRVEIGPPEKTHFNISGDYAGPAEISPDGRYLVFSAAGLNGTQLYLRPLDVLSSQALPGTEGALFPFWSPDSRSIAFFTADKLKRIDLDGRAAVTLCDANYGRGGSWNQDGTIIAALSYNLGIFRVPAGGGTPTPITKVDYPTYSSHRWPSFLPDGKHFLYSAVNHDDPASANTGVFFATLDGKENRLLFHTLSNAIYASGQLLFMRENSLMAQPFDPGAGKFLADAVNMRENVQYDVSLWRANISASRDGMLVYASGALSASRRLVWYDRSGKQLGTVGDVGAYDEVALSPDEKNLAVTEMNIAAASISIYELSGDKPKVRLAFNSGVNRNPIWSPDGRQVAFTAHQQSDISLKALDSGTPEQVLLSQSNVSPGSAQSASPGFAVTSWSPDGRYLMYQQGFDLWVFPLSGNDRKPFQYTQGRLGTFSPDGRWVAYTVVDPGRAPQVFVAPFPWTGAKWQISQQIGAEPRWRGDGKELYFSDLSQIFAVDVNGSGSTFEIGNSKPLFHIALSGNTTEYAPTRDGQRFISVAPAEGSTQSLVLLQNWAAELRPR